LSASPLHVRERDESDRAEAKRFLTERYSLRVARLGRVEQPLDHPGLVAERDDSRARLKPEIPRVGEHGIELCDELELEKVPGV
jgi:hypothetical protein